MKRLSGEDKAGLYITVIVHLTVIIILLLFRIGAVMKGEQSFVIDFTREEAMEKEKAEEKFSEAISQRIDELIAGESGVAFRNVASDRSQLKDDRGTDAEELRDGVVADEPEDDYVPVAPDPKKPAEKKPAAEYSGPSVVSYSLDGRKASKLPIPAYRCYGGGMVTVIIIVDNAGNVVNAKVQDAVSSTDKCLREFAVRAARLSKFSSDPHAPARQTGDIVYQFLAQ